MLIYRYLTKICDQVVALLSAEHTASIVWGDDDDDDESIDVDPGDDDRLFTYEVAKRNEQEESASSRPGFQVITSALSDTNSTADLPKMNSRRSFREEMEKRQEKICQELNGQESSLRRALRDEVVDDVTKLFPCVFIRNSPSTVC